MSDASFDMSLVFHTVAADALPMQAEKAWVAHVIDSISRARKG